MVEHLPLKEIVEGSSPSRPSIAYIHYKKPGNWFFIIGNAMCHVFYFVRREYTWPK